MAGQEIRECCDEQCRFRFPMAAGQHPGARCPWCGGPTQLVYSFPATLEDAAADASPTDASRLFIAALVDNVRSL